MPKTKISEFSATPANNTDIDSINIAEGCAPSGINDAIRELMAQLKDFQTGAVGDSFNGPVGSTTAAAGAFTTLTASSTLAVTGVATLTAQPILSSLTASRAVFTDASKGLVSNAITGTGNVVMSASPTLTGTVGGASLTLSSLTSGRVTYAGTSGLLQDSANLLYSGTDLTVYGLRVGRGAGAVATNTAIGNGAVFSNTSGSSNAALGFNALYTNTIGAFNSAFGQEALFSNLSGYSNSAFGYYALRNTTTGQYNTAVGDSALTSNTTASNNTAVGYQAGYSNTTGATLDAFGYQAGYSNTTGNNNTFIGRQSGYANSTGIANTAVGAEALKANTTGNSNTAIGRSVLLANTTGSSNIAVGQTALLANTTGGFNTALGTLSLSANTTASNNTAVGYQALQGNTTASNNTAVGYQALYSCTTGAPNTALGRQSGYAVTTGTDNVMLGNSAGNSTNPTTTGSGNIYIGSAAGGSAAGNNYETVLGFNIVGKGGNTTLIGTVGNVYNIGNTTAWQTTSDQRLKKNIVDNNIGLDVINQIQVRNFEYRLPEEITEVPQDQAIKKQGVQLGVIAQELQQILPECVKTESTGVMTVDADNLTWYLVNAVKELSARIKQLEGN